MRRMLGVVLGGLLLLGACTGDDDDGSPGNGDTAGRSSDVDAFVEAVSAKWQQDTEDLGLDEETAVCMIAAAVNTIGIDALNKADITPEDFASADSFGALDVELPNNAVEDLATALEGCNLVEIIAPAQLQGTVAALGGELSEDSIACITDRIDASAFAHAIAVSSLAESPGEGDAAIGDQEIAALTACPDIMTEILVTQFTAESGKRLSDAARTCIADYMAANSGAIAKAFAGTEAESVDAIGTDLAAACAETRAGVGG